VCPHCSTPVLKSVADFLDEELEYILRTAPEELFWKIQSLTEALSSRSETVTVRRELLEDLKKILETLSEGLEEERVLVSRVRGCLSGHDGHEAGI
jgi:hypothetical protein